MSETDFRKKVLNEVKKIPFGETKTYQEIANNIQNPQAVRAVANAIGSNTKFYLIPCHRVIRSDGKIGDYRWGKTLKKVLLKSEKIIKKFKSTILTLLAIYIIFSGFLFINQKHLIFYPIHEHLPIPSHLEIQEVFINTPDNIELYGWYLDNQSDLTALFFYGNAGNLSHRVHIFEMFETLNLNGLIVDYRGYGLSQGKFGNEQKMYQDAETVFQYLTQEKNIPEEQIIIWGASFGAAIAIDLAQNKNIHSLIMQTPFYSMHAMARAHYPFFPTSILVRYNFNNHQKIQNITSKKLFIHSQEDEIVPFEQAKKLYLKGNQPKYFLQIEGDHNYGFFESYQRFITGIERFIYQL